MDVDKFIGWLREQGANVLPTTNPYEVARFVARGKTCIVYQGRRGVSANGFALECVRAFQRGSRLNMGFIQKPRDALTKLRAVLLERDGPDCFFCGKPFAFEKGWPTIEHLVARGKGGPDHQDNLVLAHLDCNDKAGNMPLMEKIKLRERNLYGTVAGNHHSTAGS